MVTYLETTKLVELGTEANPGPDGYILDGRNHSMKKIDTLLELRNSGKNVCAPYVKVLTLSSFLERDLGKLG